MEKVSRPIIISTIPRSRVRFFSVSILINRSLTSLVKKYRTQGQSLSDCRRVVQNLSHSVCHCFAQVSWCDDQRVVPSTSVLQIVQFRKTCPLCFELSPLLMISIYKNVYLTMCKYKYAYYTLLLYVTCRNMDLAQKCLTRYGELNGKPKTELISIFQLKIVQRYHIIIKPRLEDVSLNLDYFLL